MKQKIKFSVFLAILLVLFAGCSKPKDFSSSYLKGKIDGVAFECTTNISANKPEPIPGTGGGDDPTIRISGEWMTHSIKLVITNEGTSIHPAKYTFETGKWRNANLIWNNSESYYAGDGCIICVSPVHGSGSITILEISKGYIKGTFEFITEPSIGGNVFKTVTDGEFYINRN